jgi:hypothetical protein
VDTSAALAADLATLAQALDDPDTDLEGQLRQLVADLKHAVVSYLGLRLTITLETAEVSFTVAETTMSTVAVVSSLGVPLPAPSPADADSLAVFYAATPGAFVDLAADLSYALGLAPSELRLDAEIASPIPESGVTGLATHAIVNQAVGVLIDRGHTPATAHQKLSRLAARDRGHLPAAAEAIVRTTTRGPITTRYRRQG